MSESQLFTAEVFQVSGKSKFLSIRLNVGDDNDRHEPFEGYKLIKRHPNMTSARVIKGKIVELEHSRLVEQPVKFKTIINYSQYLEPDTNLGVILHPQEGYLAKLDTEESTDTNQSQD